MQAARLAVSRLMGLEAATVRPVPFPSSMQLFDKAGDRIPEALGLHQAGLGCFTERMQGGGMPFSEEFLQLMLGEPASRPSEADILCLEVSVEVKDHQ